jgi:hypothetical protein
MKRSIPVLLAALALAVLMPAPAHAASRVRLYKVYFDSPGSDTRTNTSLNGEWFELKNSGTTTQNLYGWKVKDNTGYTYTFGTYYLKAGYRVHVHTGKGSNSGTHRFWQRTSYVWNNTGDKARLYNKAGSLLDSCAFSGAGDYIGC